VIALDTNILVHAHREDSDFHEAARERLKDLADSGAPWAIPWPCIHEFLAVVTHPRIWRPPTPLALALDAVEALRAAPSLVMLGETDGYWEQLRAAVLAGRVVGPRVHDARVATLCLLHGVKELWSADRDFLAFPALKVRNPLVAAGG
jgi:toxin-antitoxin system PIN domain toxin